MTSPPGPEIEVVSTLDAATAADVRALLDAAFAGRFDDHDFAHCLGGTHVLMRHGGSVVAHGAVVERRLYVGDRVLRCGYVEAVATVPRMQRRGLGHRVMTSLARLIADEFELGALSTGTPLFYERLGWQRWRGPAYVVVAGEWTRTPTEDDGVMVLEIPTGPVLLLTSPIAVDDRPGDAW